MLNCVNMVDDNGSKASEVAGFNNNNMKGVFSMPTGDIIQNENPTAVLTEDELSIIIDYEEE